MSDGTALIQLLCKVTTAGVFSPKHPVAQVCTVHFSFFLFTVKSMCLTLRLSLCEVPVSFGLIGHEGTVYYEHNLNWFNWVVFLFFVVFVCCCNVYFFTSAVCFHVVNGTFPSVKLLTVFSKTLNIQKCLDYCPRSWSSVKLYRIDLLYNSRFKENLIRIHSLVCGSLVCLHFISSKPSIQTCLTSCAVPQ